MSVLATLQQLSPLVLEQINQSAYTSETSAKIEVFRISHKISNPDNWELENLISIEDINVLKSRQIDVAQMVKATQTLIKSVKMPKIDLGREWADISIFLTGSYVFTEGGLSYIVSETCKLLSRCR
jgi:hypothetical protein